MPTSIIVSREGVQIDRVIASDTGEVVMEARPTSLTAICPQCSQASSHGHSVYPRTLRDIPLQGYRVVVHLWVRKFFCDVPACSQTIFCERLAWAPAYGRRTQAFTDELTDLGFATNVETAAKTAARIGIPSSPDTILRCLRAAPEPQSPTSAVIGIDDWAIRRGQTYGTVVVDLESHQVLDVFAVRWCEKTGASRPLLLD